MVELIKRDLTVGISQEASICRLVTVVRKIDRHQFAVRGWGNASKFRRKWMAVLTSGTDAEFPP
ncbi:MAG: hypothetical protein KDE20_23785 [Caldilineaceae bacterium]|nr:hypothetical protein [Caldilineaceae bacterium]